jgi:hypothetical protein
LFSEFCVFATENIMLTAGILHVYAITPNYPNQKKITAQASGALMRHQLRAEIPRTRQRCLYLIFT